MVAAGNGIAHPLEMVGTVLEVADIAWLAYEHRSKGHNAANSDKGDAAVEGSQGDGSGKEDEEGEISKLRLENRRLRALLEENLTVLQSLSKPPALSKDCPPDLHMRLVAAVDSANFLTQLETLQQEFAVSTDYYFPFKEEAKGMYLKSVDIVLHDDHGESSCWVWVNEEVDHNKMEELSEIDGENYVIICEDHVVDGIANFIAKCILANPKSKKLAPEELQKTVSRALGGMKDKAFMKNVWFAGKLIYALSTWGIALAGLYTHQAVVKAAARGIVASGKLTMKAL